MLQIFLQPDPINSSEWADAYRDVHRVLHRFPVPLMRVESYNGYSSEQDKFHFDLIAEAETPKEHLAVFGDRWTMVSGDQVRMYRH